MAENKYKAILIFGPPGIGKGTQAKLLGNLKTFYHFSTGDMFRNMDKNSDIGRQVSELIDKGNFVPDNLTVQLFLSTLENLEKTKKFDSKNQLLILDGIPRNAPQVSLIKNQIDVLKIISLTSEDDSILAERIEKRAKLEGRKDDNLETLKKRLEIYRKETRAVLEKYSKDIILEVDGFGKIETIYEEIIEKLEQEKIL